MISLNLVPLHQWTHREFDGVDPWDNNRPVRWSVVVYRMVSETFAHITVSVKPTVPAESNEVPKKFAIGILARAHNRYRVLPNALQELWRARKVTDEDLPWLLSRIEQPLRRSDYPPNQVRYLTLAYAIMFGLFAAIGLGFCALCVGWNWPIPVSSSDAEIFRAALWGSAAMGVISLIMLSLYRWWRRRQQSQAETWLDLLYARSMGLAA